MTKTDKGDKRERILDAAYHLFLTRGLTDTKMIDIAKAAGIGKGTIYEYFVSKDELFVILFERKVLSIYRELDEILEHKTSAKSKLIAYVSFDTSLTKDVEVSRELIYKLLADINCHCPSPARKCIKNLMDYRFSVIYNIISDGIQSGEFADADPLMASSAFMGALSFYLSVSNDLVCEKDMKPYKIKKPWKEEDFLNLVLYGLCGGKQPA